MPAAGELFSDDDFFLMDSGLVLLQVSDRCGIQKNAVVERHLSSG